MTYQGEAQLSRRLEENPGVFLSTLPPRQKDRWLALAVIIASTAMFIAAVPFAKRPLEPVPAFFPIYQSALVIIEVITALLLFGQYSILRARALLVLGCAYLFSASMAVFHALSFPGLFAKTGLLGAGPQTTAWLYFLWHAGFPWIVIAYALLRDDGPDRSAIHGSAWGAIALGVAATLGTAGALAYLATAGHDALPRIMAGDRDASTKVMVAIATWLLSIAAVPMLWRRRRYSVLDLWLMVVMVVWIFEVALAAVFNAGRYDVGWYAGRIYGFLAGSFVLGVLLLENGLIYARLVKAHGAKDRFLATMSHEIRTPLSGLLGMLELLGKTQLREAQREYLQTARDSAGGLLRIINDVLDHAKIEAGKLEIRPEPLRIHEVVRQVLSTYLAVASAKDLTLRSSVDERISALLVADGVRISQVLGNFLSNSIKFTRKGGVELRCELLAREEGREQIRFSVADTGIGIPREAQERLFQPFAQAAADTSRLYGGTGLGLAICRRLAELMGGTIAMESIEGKGTTMSLMLWLAQAAEQAAPVSATAEAPPVIAAHRAQPRILAVDDHPTNRRLLAGQLAVFGLEATLVASGEEALERWRSGAYDLVITDCNMPGMDGYALTRTMRRIEDEEKRSRTAILAWTANVLPNAVARCRAAGMDDVLTKPADLARLKETLSRWLGPLTELNVHAADSSSAAPAEAVALDPARLEQLSASGEERREILGDFLAQAHSDLKALREALSRGEARAIGSIAHRVKGASRMIGAGRLAALCERIEQAARLGALGPPEDLGRALGEEFEELNAHIAKAMA